MGKPDDVRVKCEGHHPRVGLHLFLQDFERDLDPAVQLVGGLIFDGVHGNVVELNRIGHGDHRPVLRFHPAGQVVHETVGKLIDTVFLENVRGVERLVEART